MCKNFEPFSISVAAPIRHSKTQVQIIESNRGGKIALHDGHSYNHKQSTINCIHWRCTKYYKLKCPAILKTKNETVIETRGTHNHECDPGECKAKEVVNQIKRRAQYSTPTVAIANEIYEISDDYAVQLAMPKKDKLLRAVSRKRQKAADVIEREQFEESARIIVLQAPPIRKKIKKQMQNIRSIYEFENAAPYLRAVAKFR